MALFSRSILTWWVAWSSSTLVPGLCGSLLRLQLCPPGSLLVPMAGMVAVSCFAVVSAMPLDRMCCIAWFCLAVHLFGRLCCLCSLLGTYFFLCSQAM